MFQAHSLNPSEPTMDRLFQKLTSSELDQYAGELELAIETHAEWLGNVNRSLIFGTAPSTADVSDAPHHHCHFGRWYHGIQLPELLEVTEYVELGEVHRRMHLQARELLIQRRDGIPLDLAPYDELVVLSTKLRQLIGKLRSNLKNNLNLVSRLMGKVFENAREGVVITDPQAVILNVNRAFTEMTGYSSEEAIGQTPQLLQSGKQERDFYQRMWSVLQRDGQWQGEIWNRRKNGDIYLEWLAIAAVRSETGEVSHYVGIFSDITEQKNNEERLYHLAHYDQLTEIPNRVLFMDRFRQAVARARRNESKIATMFLDLDGFKEINDSLGHSAGDELLGQVAQRLVSVLRASDTVARFGGDEFTVMLPDMDSCENVIFVAQKIIELFQAPFQLEAGEARVTTSIGISLYPDDALDADNLVTRADAAMYAAKSKGKNTFAFYESAQQR